MTYYNWMLNMKKINAKIMEQVAVEMCMAKHGLLARSEGRIYSMDEVFKDLKDEYKRQEKEYRKEKR